MIRLHCKTVSGRVWIVPACLMIAAAQSAPPPPLSELVKKPYLELVELAPSFNYSKRAIDDYRKQLETQKKEDLDGVEAEKKSLQAQEDDVRRQLQDLNSSASVDDAAMATRRAALHCKLYQVDRDLHESKTERSISVPIEYDHRLSKLEIIALWPATKRQVEQAVADGQGRVRKWGDVDDIGFRKLGEGQERDLKLGEDAVRELTAYDLMPPACDSRPLNDYVRDVGERIAKNSDLRVPLRVEVLDTAEINAFGLPGGRLLVNAGLIVRTANEAELAGVLAHEIAHIAARHGEKLTRPTASVTRMLFQGATMAADAFTGGAVGTARNAARDVLGLGVHLNLNLLGVNRETEVEAGQLATQYLWHTGYDPRGFMHFYDKMVSEPSHRLTASFFRTHPPSSERALLSLAELAYLPKKPRHTENTPRFERMHALAETWLKTHPKVIAAAPAACRNGALQ